MNEVNASYCTASFNMSGMWKIPSVIETGLHSQAAVLCAGRILWGVLVDLTVPHARYSLSVRRCTTRNLNTVLRMRKGLA